MIDRETQRRIESLWTESRSTTLTAAARLERKAEALRMIMRVALDAASSAKEFWDDTGLLALTLAANSGEAIDDGGTYTKEEVIAVQSLFNSFAAWSRATTVTIDGNDITLPATPRQMFAAQPERVS